MCLCYMDIVFSVLQRDRFHRWLSTCNAVSILRSAVWCGPSLVSPNSKDCKTSEQNSSAISRGAANKYRRPAFRRDSRLPIQTLINIHSCRSNDVVVDVQSLIERSSKSLIVIFTKKNRVRDNTK